MQETLNGRGRQQDQHAGEAPPMPGVDRRGGNGRAGQSGVGPAVNRPVVEDVAPLADASARNGPSLEDRRQAAHSVGIQQQRPEAEEADDRELDRLVPAALRDEPDQVDADSEDPEYEAAVHVDPNGQKRRQQPRRASGGEAAIAVENPQKGDVAQHAECLAAQGWQITVQQQVAAG